MNESEKFIDFSSTSFARFPFPNAIFVFSIAFVMNYKLIHGMRRKNALWQSIKRVKAETESGIATEMCIIEQKREK